MSKSLSPLKTTTPDLHRFYVCVTTTTQWYAVMQECRAWFGKEWRTQPKIRRRLEHSFSAPIEAWFEVPDPTWSTWVATKLSLEIKSGLKKV